MPGYEHTYTYRHLLRFGQTLVVAALVLGVPLLLALLGGTPVDMSLVCDGLLFTTVILYGINYRHTFTGSVYLSSRGLFVNRLVLARQEFYWQDVRRITLQELPPGYLGLLAGPRLRMTLIGAERLEIEVSDLENHGQFLRLVSLLAESHGIRISRQDQDGAFLLDGGPEAKRLTA